MKDKRVITVIRVPGVKKKDGAYRILIDGRSDPRNYTFVSYSDIEKWFESMQENGFYTDCILKLPSDY